ncbi:hypothetical protein DIPPA_35073 [Diplonema papillatum]|nr:hypothetical protein DIPPA_35073 [Diplonema papillatum]|eukprot:gene2493-3867_t
MNIDVFKGVWNKLSSGAKAHQFLEKRPEILDEAADDEERDVVAWMSRPSEAHSIGVHSIVASACQLVSDCERGVKRSIDMNVAGAGTQGCESALNDALTAFEEAHAVRVLHATECGSRAFGWGSKDSDFDVKLVFRHNTERYLNHKPRDNVTTVSFTCWANLDTDSPVDITVQAYDIAHFLDLLRESNPTALDCLFSPVVWRTHPAFNELKADTAQCVNFMKFVQSRLSVVQATAANHLGLRVAVGERREKKHRAQHGAGVQPSVPTVRPKEYIIMLRAVADVAFVVSQCDGSSHAESAGCSASVGENEIAAASGSGRTVPKQSDSPIGLNGIEPASRSGRTVSKQSDSPVNVNGIAAAPGSGQTVGNQSDSPVTGVEPVPRSSGQDPPGRPGGGGAAVFELPPMDFRMLFASFVTLREKAGSPVPAGVQQWVGRFLRQKNDGSKYAPEIASADRRPDVEGVIFAAFDEFSRRLGKQQVEGCESSGTALISALSRRPLKYAYLNGFMRRVLS